MKPPPARAARARACLPVMTGEHAFFLIQSLQAVIDALWRVYEADLVFYMEGAGIPYGRPRGARWTGDPR